MKKINLVMVLLLGTAVAVSATATVKGALAMAIAAAIVMIATSALVKVVKEPSATTIVLMTTVITCVVDLLLHAFLPSLYEMSGLYISLLAVNLLSYSASKRTVSDTVKTAVFFAIVLVCVGAVREVLGNYIMIASKETGGLLVYAFAAAIVNKIAPAEDMCIGTALGLNGGCCCHKEGE